ncbi:glycosyltransferase family 4 protein [Microbacterium oxydans]|uniref:glycosyltransferase family 4 protein n=1 Tax=Microbacterium oxydans TaxID=82380 RepID=UPI00226B2524|nr:glycosyltransferase family 4 protein [Microbacterium oxydans]WAA67395.1 glycosyltransferase family 4 protein [Microbacterium oxydans]
MRVLAVTPWFPSEVRPGLGLFNLRDAEMLALDHEVTVLHLHDPSLGGDAGEWDASPGIHVVRIPYHYTRPWTIPRALRTLRRLAAGADVVHTMAFPALLPVQLASLPKPWVHTEHWSGLLKEPTTVRGRVGHAVLRRGLRRPDAVVAVGHRLAQIIEAIRHEPVPVIENFVRIAEPDRIAEQWDASSGGPLRMVAVGGLVPWKGPIQAVEALAALRSRGFDARFEWAGVGRLHDAVETRAAELGVSDHMRLLGHVSPEALADVLPRAHLFVMASEYETFGIAYAEALGHGLSVIASGSGGHLAFLPDEASRVVEERTGLSLAGAVADLLGDPDRWTPSQIYDYAKQRFSPEERRSSYREIYQQLG